MWIAVTNMLRTRCRFIGIFCENVVALPARNSCPIYIVCVVSFSNLCCRVIKGSGGGIASGVLKSNHIDSSV